MLSIIPLTNVKQLQRLTEGQTKLLLNPNNDGKHVTFRYRCGLLHQTDNQQKKNHGLK